MVKLTVRGTECELHKIAPTETKGDGWASKTSPPHEYSDRDVAFGSWTAYEVLVDGKRIGVVASQREESETVHRRIRYVRGVTRYWVATRCGRKSEHERRVGYHYYSRQDAVEGLVREVNGS